MLHGPVVFALGCREVPSLCLLPASGDKVPLYCCVALGSTSVLLIPGKIEANQLPQELESR